VDAHDVVPVHADDLERELERLRHSAAGPEEGFFGPESMLWRIDREALVFLGAGRALLLQLAHPWVSTGIAEHSRTLADPIGRFHRTFNVVYTLVFGSLEQSLHMARRLHRRHAVIRGELPDPIGPFAAQSPYFANEASALLWVHATLVDTALVAHDLVLPPLSAAEREAYYQESRRLGALFGIPPERQPADWTSFEKYMETLLQSDALTVSPAARAIAGQILTGAGSWLFVPAWYRALTASLLPERLRAEFGLPDTGRDRERAERAHAWIRRVYPKLPARIRQVGPYREALGRLEGRRRPDGVTQLLNRFWIGRPTMGAAAQLDR
jgi:uncharacterized protein (DUF2236 family)